MSAQEKLSFGNNAWVSIDKAQGQKEPVGRSQPTQANLPSQTRRCLFGSFFSSWLYNFLFSDMTLPLC